MTNIQCKCLLSSSPLLLIIVNNANKIHKVNKKGKHYQPKNYVSKYTKNVIYECV